MTSEEAVLDLEVSRSAEGHLAARGGRAVLASAAGLWRLTEELEETLGRATARGVLARFGFYAGEQEAARLRARRAWGSDADCLRAGARVLEAIGVGRASFSRLSVDRPAKGLEAVCDVEGAFEAAMSKARRGPAAEPVCDRLAGWLTGFGTALLGEEVLFVEEECAGCAEGATRCRFVGRRAEGWGGAAASIRALYRREPVGEGLASRDRALFAQAVTIQEQELALEEKRRVEEASRKKSEFLASISHELRTPLNSIVGYADLILSRLGPKLPETPRKNLERILSNAEHLRRLIDGVLDLSKIESGRLELKLRATDPRALLEPCLEDTRVLLAGKPVELVADPGPLPAVLVDATRLRQCLLNVLGNAAKFTAAGSIRVTAARLPAEAPGTPPRAQELAHGWLALAIADTGPGIAPEHQALVFEPFRQVDATATRHGGTGLGLAIVRQLVARMGGQVRLTSALGAGSTFTLVLPLADPAADVVPWPAPTPQTTPRPAADPPEQAPTAPGGEAEVLLIDDDPDAAVLAGEALAGSTARLIVEVDPVRGLAVARTRPPRLILLDLRLPGVDGREVLRLLRSDPRTSAVPVVCCSVRDDLLETLEDGATYVLKKPITAADLRETVERIALRRGGP